jgi:RNA polymerase sigma-70 factor (ECF subfamily)
MENHIIKKCVNGDLEEFGKLYDLYAKKIYQFIYFKVHHKETAEDLVSTTFMKALEGIQKFDQRKASFKTWLYSIARNSVIDHYRADRPTADIEDALGIRSSEDIERDTDMQMKIESVEKYMERLKPEQRELVLLRVWEGLSFKEIAEVTGKSEGACKVSFGRIITRLREDFAPFMILLLLIK